MSYKQNDQVRQFDVQVNDFYAYCVLCKELCERGILNKDSVCLECQESEAQND